MGDIAKELGKRWGEVDEATKANYAAMAEKDKARYERVSCLVILWLEHFHLSENFFQDMNAYKKQKTETAQAEEEDDDDDDEEDDD